MEAVEAASSGAPAVDAAVKAASAAAAGGPAAPAAVVVGPIPNVQDEARFVVETVEGIKGTVVGVGAQMARIDPGCAPVQRLALLSPLAREALRSNAALVAPILREHLGGGWWVLGAALAFDALVTLQGFRALLEARDRATGGRSDSTAAASEPDAGKTL